MQVCILVLGFRTTLMKSFDPLQILTSVYYFLFYLVFTGVQIEFSSFIFFISENY